MVALAISAILFLFQMELIQKGKEEQNSFYKKVQAISVAKEIKTILANPLSCMATVGGQIASNTPQGTIQAIKQSMPDLTVQNKIQVGIRYGEVTLLNFSLSEKNKALLQFGKTALNFEIEHSPWTIKEYVEINVKVDGGGSIIACSSSPFSSTITNGAPPPSGNPGDICPRKFKATASVPVHWGLNNAKNFVTQNDVLLFVDSECKNFFVPRYPCPCEVNLSSILGDITPTNPAPGSACKCWPVFPSNPLDNLYFKTRTVAVNQVNPNEVYSACQDLDNNPNTKAQLSPLFYLISNYQRNMSFSCHANGKWHGSIN
jgi:hypothetical protein